MKGQQTKHTPGPWKASRSYGIESNEPFLVWAESKQWAVAQCFCATHAGNDAFKEQTANARLIAAAPELLEALRGLVDLCACDSRFNQRSAMKNARVAIAKATQF